MSRIYSSGACVSCAFWIPRWLCCLFVINGLTAIKHTSAGLFHLNNQFFLNKINSLCFWMGTSSGCCASDLALLRSSLPKLLAEAHGTHRVALADVPDDCAQVVAGHRSPFNTVRPGRHARFLLTAGKAAMSASIPDMTSSCGMLGRGSSMDACTSAASHRL